MTTQERRAWAEQELRAAGVGQTVETSVLRLLDIWYEMNFDALPPTQSGAVRGEVLRVFGELAAGHRLAVEDERSWFPLQRMRPQQGDTVRVLRDAFDGERGELLNGKEGTIARISRGLVVVAFGEGGSEGVQHFEMAQLEVLR